MTSSLSDELGEDDEGVVSSELDDDVVESDSDDSADDELDVDEDRFFGLRTCCSRPRPLLDSLSSSLELSELELFLARTFSSLPALNFKPCGMLSVPRLKVTAVGALTFLCLETVSPCPALLIDNITSLKPVGRTGCFPLRSLLFSWDFLFLCFLSLDFSR